MVPGPGMPHWPEVVHKHSSGKFTTNNGMKLIIVCIVTLFCIFTVYFIATVYSNSSPTKECKKLSITQMLKFGGLLDKCHLD